MSDVEALRSYHMIVRSVARTHGGQAGPGLELIRWADGLLDSDASASTRAALLSALAGLHSGVAWWCHDGGDVAASLYHFGRAVELATEAGDDYGVVYALRHAGMMLIERGRVDDALKLLQLADLRLQAAYVDSQLRALASEFHVVSAFALASLSRDYGSTGRLAREELAQARDGWDPPSEHARGSMDLIAAQAEMNLGRLDVAEAMVTVAGQTLAQSGDRREGILTELIRARMHVQAGEPRGLAMANAALDGVEQIRSGVARQIYVSPLASALEVRSGSEARELARRARQVAA